MLRRTLRTGLAALCVLGGLSTAAFAAGKPGAPPVFRTGLESLEKQVQEFTLPNGLRFLVLERHQAPVFSFFTVVNSGSANDAVGTTGIAHMMEHMAFKGTTLVGTTDYAAEKPLLAAEDRAWAELFAERQKGARADAARLAALEKSFADAQAAARKYVATNEFTQIVEQAGGQGINAFTAEDITAYFYSLPSNRLEMWASLFSGAMIDPVFREFYKERDVVYEERRMRVESSPIGRLFYEFITTSFNAHPYGFGGIGYPSDLKSFSREQGEEFFRRNYVAKNMTIAVVGDVTLADVKRLAEKYFSGISGAPAPPALTTVEPKQIAERRVTIEDKAQPIVLVGWHIPAASDPKYAAYKAAADLLGGGRWSRLYKALVKDKKIAVQAGTGTGNPGEKYPNLFTMFLVPAAGQDPEKVEQEAYAVIEDVLGAHPFTDDELKGYKVRMRAQKIGAMEGNDDVAGELAQAQALYGDWREFFREQERVQSLTVADLAAVLRESLVKSNRTVGMIKPPAAPAAPAAEGGR
ncbi:MAG: pitrilysin family protein [Candidatus Eisenbacteria bacterium]